jgi:N-acetyl-gamma-glutamyl-phosphate reductase
MMATVYADLMPGIDPSELLSVYKSTYEDEWFVRVLPPGHLPDTRQVACTNFADISVHHDARTGKVKAICAIDNLGKGAAAQAVQAINLMAGLPENEGLANAALSI